MSLKVHRKCHLYDADIHTRINIFMSIKVHRKCHLYDADIHTRINIFMSIKLHRKCHLYDADIHTRINILMSIKLHWNYHCNGHYNRMPDLGEMCEAAEHVGLSKVHDPRRKGTRS